MDENTSRGRMMSVKVISPRYCALALALLTFSVFIYPAYQLKLSLVASVEATVGDVFSLECHIDQVTSINWVRWNIWSNASSPPDFQSVITYNPDTHDKSWGNQVNRQNVDIRWLPDHKGGANFMLRFQRVTCNDGGRYQCHVNATSQHVGTTEMKIVADPEMPKITYSNIEITELELEDGQSATLTCSGRTGFPKRKMLWYFVEKGKDTLEPRDGQIVRSAMVDEGCWFETESQLTVTMTQTINESRIWCYVYRIRDLEIFTISSVITKSSVTFKYPKRSTDSPGPQDGCQGETCGTAHLRMSHVTYLIVFAIMVIQYVA